jgi:hypothetical protein
MSQQFGAGWEQQMQSLSQRLGMYGGGQPAPVTAPPGTTPPAKTAPGEPPVTPAHTTQGEEGWPQADWSTPATSLASAVDLARAAPSQLKAAVQERMTQPWSVLKQRVQENLGPVMPPFESGRGGGIGPTGGTLEPTLARQTYEKFATPPQGTQSIWEMSGTPYKKFYPSVNRETLKRYKAAQALRTFR